MATLAYEHRLLLYITQNIDCVEQRGWTLQEGLLAPRTLSYGAQQMMWECPEYQADEGGRIT